MATERQFFRDISPGDVSIEGRKSNGITADINGNTIIYASIKQDELEKLNQEQYVGNVPVDGYTSTFIAALAPGQLPPYPEGNNNIETLDEKTDPNKIVVAKPPTPPASLYDPCQKLTEADKREFILDVVKNVLSDGGKSKKYTDIIPLDGGTVGIAHFATGGLAGLYRQMGDALIQKYFGKDKNNQPMTVEKMVNNYSDDCLPDAYSGEAKNDTGWGCYSGGHNPLGINWKDGMTKFLNDVSNNKIQDDAIVVSREGSVNISEDKGWNTPFEWAVAIGISNSKGNGGFRKLAEKNNWNAQETLKAYINEKSSNHRKKRANLINQYFPPCGGSSVPSPITKQGTNTPTPTTPPQPVVIPLPSREIVQINAAPVYEFEVVFTESPGLSQEAVVMMTGSLDIDLGTSPEITLQGNNETNIAKGKTDYSNIRIIKLGSVTYKSDGTINVGSKANEFLPRDASGAITPYYNFIAAAKASIGTFTKTLKHTEKTDKNDNPIPDTGGALGCGGGVAIIYLRATGHGLDWDPTKSPPKPGERVNLPLGTASIYNLLRLDKKNWRQRANWRDAQPGDCLNTVTIGVKNGHIGWVVDTKLNDGVSWDVVSNSSSGYTGTKTDKSLKGSIQNNYTVNKWSEIANRKGVGPTYAYEFIGKFDEPNRTI